MGDLIRTVRVGAMAVDGSPLGDAREYLALLDTGATRTVIPRRILTDLDHRPLVGRHTLLGGRRVPLALVALTLDSDVPGCPCDERVLLAVVSDAQARKVAPEADLILGHDYLQDARAVLRYTVPHRVSCEVPGRRRATSRR